MPDTVTLILDAEQYYREIAKVTSRSQGLTRTGERVGEGFLRGERAFRTASRNIVASLATTQDAATGALIAAAALEKVFKIGILPTVVAAGAIAFFEVFHKQIERTKKAADDLSKELGKPLGLQAQKGVEALTEDIEALEKKMADLRNETNSTTSSILGFLSGSRGFGGGFGATAAGLKAGQIPPAITKISEEEKKQIDAEKRLNQLATERADKEIEIAEAKRDNNKIAQLQLDYEDKRAKLFTGVFKAGLNQLDLMKRLIALQIRLNSEVEEEGKARAKAQRESLNTAGDFFADVGSGRFAQQFRESQQHDIDTRRGQALIDELRRGQDRGFFQDPLSQAELRAADRLADKAGTGLATLINADFSNLQILSKYDFSGLAPLSNLEIIIK